MNFYKLTYHLKTTLDLIINEHFKISARQTVYVEFVDIPETLIQFTLNHFIAREIYVFYNIKYQEIINSCAINYEENYYKKMAAKELDTLKRADYYIGLRLANDVHGFSTVNLKLKEKILKNYIEPVHFNYRNNNMNWLYFRLPSDAFAQNAKMKEDQFLEYYFTAMNINYKALEKELEPFKELLFNSCVIKILNERTDISFNIDKMPVICDTGQHNLPDGEIRTAPVKDSVNGCIRFNIPSTYYGHYFSDVELVFKNGKVIGAKSKEGQKELNAILDWDDGARYTGEFAIGVNPYIDRPVNDILFDEKIHGSLHFALGNAYPKCDNGNRSCIHWDLILSLNKEKGGGEMYFDDILIMKDGEFILPSLKNINLPTLKSCVRENI